MRLGAHVSTAGGISRAPETGRSIGAEAIQIFSKSPHSWTAPPLDPEEAARFRAEMERTGLSAASVHHNYLTNLASPKESNYRASRASFRDDLERSESLGARHLIFHPGAHVGSGTEAGIRRIAAALVWAIGETPKYRVRILLENAAGQGTTLGSTFEELARILDAVGAPERVGIALDTCHLFASGVEFRTDTDYGAVLDRLQATVGADRVRAFHLNDSVAGLGSHLDRHANIGRGALGIEGFRRWVTDRRWAEVPGYLETPLADESYATYRDELAALRALAAPPPRVARPRSGATAARRRRSA